MTLQRITSVDDNKKKSHTGVWVYSSVLFILLITFQSNPDREEHVDALRMELTGMAERAVIEKTDNMVAIGLSKIVADRVIDVIKNIVNRKLSLFLINEN